MICISFDTDHMSRESMSRFLSELMINMPGKGTFFVHDSFSDLLTTDHEICPHPFISDLNKWDADLIRIESSLPHKPRGTRTHSCVFSHMVGIGLKEKGYNYISQAHNLYSNNLKPFRHPWGIWELPIYYMDNMDFWFNKNWPELEHKPFSNTIINKAMADESLYVFDFHPIHIALNTRCSDDYTNAKQRITDEGICPFDLSFDGYGVRSFFMDLCHEMSANNIISRTLSESLEHYTCEQLCGAS